MWSSSVQDGSCEGYTWESFKNGWKEDLSVVFRSLGDDDCLWTCCQQAYNAPPCNKVHPLYQIFFGWCEGGPYSNSALFL